MVATAAERYLEMELLRFSTAGSVDDGKSTLIGRLLYEAKGIFEDQLEEAERTSLKRGGDYVNLALLTDGLRAEREQGITIDVAYRYFATPKRKFIIADTPGHAQYTRNMITGTSTADAAVILLDAARGITEQSRRHAYIAGLMRVPHVVVCVNKLDLVGYDEAVFKQFATEFGAFCRRMGIAEPHFIPISALVGDNVVERSTNMPWYGGPTLLEYLETVPLAGGPELAPARFPVQWVNRPLTHAYHDYRGYSGQLVSGVLRPGDDVLVLPAALPARLETVETFDGPLSAAYPPLSLTLLLDRDLDVSRGDLICHPTSTPRVGRELTAMLCWMAGNPLHPGSRFAIKHTTRSARAIVGDIDYRVDVNTLTSDTSATELRLNDIARVRLRVSQPLCYDLYAENRATGSFILIDEHTNVTVAAGMIVEE